MAKPPKKRSKEDDLINRTSRDPQQGPGWREIRNGDPSQTTDLKTFLDTAWSKPLHPPKEKVSKIIKEFQPHQIDMRGPGNPRAKAADAGSIAILRLRDGGDLTWSRARTLFNEAARDFPNARPADVTIEADRLTIKTAEAPKGYTPLPPQIHARRG